MPDQVKRVSARELKAQLHDGDELALLDAREEGVFGRRHLLMASCVPLSRLEVLIDDLVPRRTARVVERSASVISVSNGVVGMSGTARVSSAGSGSTGCPGRARVPAANRGSDRR